MAFRIEKPSDTQLVVMYSIARGELVSYTIVVDIGVTYGWREDSPTYVFQASRVKNLSR